VAKDSPPIEAEKLGEVEGEYPASRRRWVAPILIVVSSGVMVAMARLVLTGEEQKFITFIGLGVLGLGLLVVLLLFAQRSMKVTVFEKGLVAYRGRQYVVVRWNSIAALWAEVSRMRPLPFVNHAYTIELRNDQKLQFTDDLRHVTELGALLQERTLSALLEQASKDYEKGRKLDFGPFSLDKAGIASGGEVTAWGEIERLTLDEAALLVKRNHEETIWLSVPASRIANPHVLAALAEKLIAEFSLST